MSSPRGGSTPVPAEYCVGQEIDWDAPWIDVSLWVELPFWLAVGDAIIDVEVEGHRFETAIHERYFELHGGVISDSKEGVAYRGPFKEKPELPEEIRNVLNTNPGFATLWRKCKTVLKIKSRCNEFVWNTRTKADDLSETKPFPLAARRAISLYLAELCRAHIPVVNKLVQQYRLATYDYFPYEVSPWDISFWLVERSAKSVRVGLVPYREWDFKPMGYAQPFQDSVKAVRAGQKPDSPSLPYELIETGELRNKMSFIPSPGELELLDALNLMERGDYSGAVRRVTTAIEVIVEAVVRKIVIEKEGEQGAVQFLKDTEVNFPKRVSKYEQLSGRSLPDAHRKELQVTRQLRHRIVHRGYRIAPSERGRAQRAVDTGRWIFDWFENDKARFDVREKKIAFRGLGRDLAAGVFPTKIVPEGVVVSPFHR